MTNSPNKTVVIIVGPTAVGKTGIAIELAHYFNTEIISADSRQCFKELNIGAARPSAEELEKIKHYFIASHSITEPVNAAVFEKYALEKTREIFKTHDQAVMVGGTGLYVKAFCEGLHEMPVTDPAIRERIVRDYEEKGLTWLQQEIKINDPEFFQKAEIKNPQRMMRALEIKQSTGQSILSFRKGEKAKRDFRIVRVGLELPKEELHWKIHERVDRMMSEGLLDEVKELKPFKKYNALQTVGYSELFGYLDEKITLAEAIELIKRNTRQYAKRQMTWFRKDKEVHWFASTDLQQIILFLKS